jgi:hypothetical protein
VLLFVDPSRPLGIVLGMLGVPVACMLMGRLVAKRKGIE